jgi:hypothetical protein
MEKLKLAKKAYIVDLSRIEEGYLYSHIGCYANTVNKAKIELLKMCDDQGVYMKDTNYEVSYLNIPVIRHKKEDKYFIEDLELTQREYDEIIRKRHRKTELDMILADELITHCYIHKGSYYKPHSSGYTDMRYHAGVYEKKEAVSSARNVDNIVIIPIDIIEHNEMINKEIEDLQTRLILTK